MTANADIPVSDGERRHDPLCPDGRADHNKPPVSRCGWCEFATRVREDERAAEITSREVPHRDVPPSSPTHALHDGEPYGH